MKEYLFRTFVTLGEDNVEVDYVRIEANNILEARKKFAEHAAERYHAVREWCLLNVYREI